MSDHTEVPKPCPFCGGSVLTMPYNGTMQATCAGNHECPGTDVIAPIPAWNRRAAPSGNAELADRLDAWADDLLYGTTDGSVWAHEFLRIAKGLSYSAMDEGWLIGWFANAIECGRAAGQKEAAALRAARNDALEEAAKVAEGGSPGFDFDAARAECRDSECGFHSGRITAAKAIRARVKDGGQG